jgi:hypothetical protein
MRVACLSVLLLLAGLVRADDLHNPCPGHGYFSCEAVEISDLAGLHNGSSPGVISSPDGSRKLVVRRPKKPEYPYESRVSVAVGDQTFSTYIGYLLNAEALWAPDSSAFTVTYSDGGAVGDYLVELHYVGRSGLRNIDPTKIVKRDFMARPLACGGSREEPNLAVVRWGDDSKSLYIAAEVQPHSVCDSMGTFRLYKVSLPRGRILASWGQLEAKRKFWKSLGVELRNAEDDYIRDPVSCYVPYNHPECFPVDEKPGAKMPS